MSKKCLKVSLNFLNILLDGSRTLNHEPITQKQNVNTNDHKLKPKSNLIENMRKKNSDRRIGEQGWRSGESARLPLIWLGFDSRTRHHMWVEFVVDSLPCPERFFSG